MTTLLAQGPSFWPSVVQALSNNGLWVFIAVCVMSATAKQLVERVLEHRERMATLEAGMQPPEKDATYPVGYTDKKRSG